MRTIVLIFLSLAASGQEPYMWHISTDDGLETETVYDVMFDDNGLAWLGTYGGLISYSGHKAELHNSKNVGTKLATHLQMNDDGNIFYINFSNVIFRYNVQKDSTYRIENNIIANNGKNGDFFLCENGEVWLKTGSGLARTRIRNDSFTTFDTLQRHIIDNTNDNENGDIWTTVGHAVTRKTYFYNVRSNKSFSSPANLKNYYFHTVIDSSAWISKGYHEGDRTSTLITVNIYSGKIDTIWHSADCDIIRSTCLDIRDDEIWLGTTNGLIIMPLHRQLPSVEAKLFEGSTISKLTSDVEGNFWVSTTDNGIWVIPNVKVTNLTKSFQSFQKTPVIIQSVNANDWLVAAGDKNVYYFNENLEQLAYVKTAQNEIINYLQLMPHNIIYVGGHSGFHSYDLNTGRKFNNAYASKMFGIKEGVTADGILYTSTWAGVYQILLEGVEGILPKKHDFIHLAINPDYRENLIQLFDKRSQYVFFDSLTSDLWVGTADGPWVFNQRLDSVKRLVGLNGKEYSVVITKCLRDEKGELWMTTGGSGLLHIKNRQVIAQYTEENGLLDNVITDMDDVGNEIWMATYSGLQMFNSELKTFTKYSAYQGIEELPYHAVAVNREYVMVGHKKVSLLFKKDEVFKQLPPPPIFIRNVSINDQDTGILDQYTLDYKHNNIRVSLATIHYSPSKTYSYEYSFGQYEESWLGVPAEANKLTFSSLKPGHHKLSVRAVNSVGTKSSEAKVLWFNISPPFWQTLWFQIAIVMLTVVLVSFIAFSRIRTLKKQARLFKAKTDAETERQELEVALKEAQLSAIKAQLNPHFMFNALNSIQEFILLNDRKQANRFLGKFADLMRLILDNSNAKTISLVDEIKMLDLYLQLEGLRFEEHFSYEIDLSPDISTSEIEIPSMLIQPYVENGIKHGLLHKKDNKKLTVSFHQIDSNTLKVSIEDNGIGRENSEKINVMRKNHTSFATGANEHRLRLLNGDRNSHIAVEIIDLYNNQDPSGTKVILTIPIDLMT